jgi:hypothetical protein
LALFGLRRASVVDGQHGGQGLTFLLDITRIFDELYLAKALDVGSLRVSLLPSRAQPRSRWDGSSLEMLLASNSVTSLAGGWVLMLAAMMAPMLVRPIYYIRISSFARRRPRSIAFLCSRLWCGLDGGWLRHAGPGISSNMVGASVLSASNRRWFSRSGLADIAFQATLP